MFWDILLMWHCETRKYFFSSSSVDFFYCFHLLESTHKHTHARLTSHVFKKFTALLHPVGFPLDSLRGGILLVINDYWWSHERYKWCEENVLSTLLCCGWSQEKKERLSSPRWKSRLHEKWCFDALKASWCHHEASANSRSLKSYHTYWVHKLKNSLSPPHHQVCVEVFFPLLCFFSSKKYLRR